MQSNMWSCLNCNIFQFKGALVSYISKIINQYTIFYTVCIYLSSLSIQSNCLLAVALLFNPLLQRYIPLLLHMCLFLFRLADFNKFLPFFFLNDGAHIRRSFVTLNEALRGIEFCLCLLFHFCLIDSSFSYTLLLFFPGFHYVVVVTGVFWSVCQTHR